MIEYDYDTYKEIIDKELEIMNKLLDDMEKRRKEVNKNDN